MVRFSSRLAWSLEPSTLASAIAENPAGLLDLTQSNPTEAAVGYPAERILAALQNPQNLLYQPASNGLLSAREAVAGHLGNRVSPEALVLTASTSEAYSYLFKLLCDPGDRVLVPRPSYPLFEFLAQLECVEPRQYRMHYDGGWFVDIDSVRDAVDERTRAIVFVNPNNPTGSYLKRDEYEALAGLGLPLIVDEVFAQYALREDSIRVDTVTGRQDVLTFALSGLSKLAGLPQMKLGWIAASGPDSEAALRRLELIADTYLSPSTPTQLAAPEFLEIGAQVAAAIRERCRRNLAALRATPLRVLDVEGGWYATVQVPRTRSEEEWVLHLLQEHSVLVQPGYFYDFESEAFLVLSLLTESSVFDEGLRRLILAAHGL